jgi:acyl-CoA dehydrogenase
VINLEIPKKMRPVIEQAHQVAEHLFRPISRKYDRAEHEYPKELDMLAALLDGLSAAGGTGGAGAAGAGKGKSKDTSSGTRNGANLATVLGLTELCWGDVGLALTIPRQGLGNAAISAVANEEQLARFGSKWAAMAITEPGAGSDSAAIRTTARKDGDHYVINGEKIFVTAGSRADAVVVWATLDPNLGRAAIKSFVVPKGAPGMRVVRLDHKLGIRASDTAVLAFDDCRVPAANLLGTAEIDAKKGFAGVMQTFDNTRPLVAAMAVGLTRACLEQTQELLQ